MANCSSCLLTAGFQNSCEFKQPGGNNVSIYIGNHCEFSFTITADIITAAAADVTAPGTYSFFTARSNKDTVSTTENIILPNKFVSQTVTFNIQNIAEDADLDVGATIQKQFLDELLNGESYFVIVRDRAGVYRLYGYTNGLSMSNGEKASGAALTDVASTGITLDGAEPTYAYVIEETVVDTLLAGIVVP